MRAALLRGILSGLLVMPAVCAAPGVAFADRGGPVDLDWVAPSACPSQAEMLETDGVEHRLQGSSSEPSHVLNELIIALMRKRVLTDAEGKAMLKRLME